MVVGNSVEEDKIYVGKNEVGIQMDNSTKENMNALEEHSLNKRTVSNKINVKLNRRITEFNENLKLDRSFKPERRGVLMFRNWYLPNLFCDSIIASRSYIIRECIGNNSIQALSPSSPALSTLPTMQQPPHWQDPREVGVQG